MATKANQDQIDWFTQYSNNRKIGKGQTAERDKYYATLSNKYGWSQTQFSDPKVQNSYDALSGKYNSIEDFNKLEKTEEGFVKLPNGQYATPDGLMTLDQAGYDKYMTGVYEQKDKDMLQKFLDQQKSLTDPIMQKYNEYLATLTGQHNNNLNMIDREGNRTLQGVSDNNFLAAQQNDQNLSDRGMISSGVGDEFRTRTQMSANRNIQDAYSQIAQQKANENSQFSQNENQIKLALAELNPEAKANAVYQNWLETTGGSKGTAEAKKAAEAQAKLEAEKMALEIQGKQSEIDAKYSAQTGTVWLNGKNTGVPTSSVKVDQAKLQLELAKFQSSKDKQLTDSTGFLWANGKQVKVNGKPIKTVDFMKLEETQRNNIVKSQIAQQNANTNSYNAETKRSKALADVAARAKEIQIKQQNADLNSSKYNLSVQKYNDSVTKAVADIGNKNLTAQVKDLQRKAKDMLSLAKKEKNKDKKADLIKKYNAYNKQIEAAINKYATYNSGK